MWNPEYAGGNVGGFLAPVLTPYIASQAGWSWGLYAGSLMALVGVVACYFADPTARPSNLNQPQSLTADQA
jgi:dipeptide/tripeptide permease